MMSGRKQVVTEHTFLWILKHDDHNWYDTYDSCIVAASSKDEARKISPSGSFGRKSKWAISPEKVIVTKIGVTQKHREGQVILSSYNAG